MVLTQRGSAGKAPKKPKRVAEIENLLLRLRAIEKEMPVEDLNKEMKKKASAADRFLEAKSEFLKGMSSVKADIGALRDASGVTRSRDQVAQAQRVRKQLKELGDLFTEMERLYMKESRKKRSKLTAEELETRAQFLREFKARLESLKRLSSRASTVSSAATTDTAFDDDLEIGGGGFDFSKKFQDMTSSKSNAGAKIGGGGREVELTEVQQQSLEQIKRRDEEFDQILDQIGAAIEQAGEKAKLMQDETSAQNAMLDKLEENVVKTKVKMDNMNERMVKNLEDRGMGMERFCINFMCFILLLGVVGLIVSVVG